MERPELNFAEFVQSFRRVEYQRQAYFTEIAATVAEETGLPFFLGRAT